MTMALSVCSILAFSLTLCVVLQEGCGVPLSGQPNTPTQAPQQQQQQQHRVRVKRCSCNSWLDTECIYFCHLDIIWVNTPSKIIPYGLGSPLSRRRRSTGRCECANPADGTCSSFCHNSSENPAIIVAGPLVQTDGSSDTNGNRLLASLRSVIRSNMASAKEASSSRKKPSRANRLNIR